MAERPSGKVGQVPRWVELNNLASGGEVIFASDDWFAAAERLLLEEGPEWREGFTEQGKWMDGWETRRKRIPGHDWCLIRLGLPGLVEGVELDTSFFTGNFAPQASLQGAWLGPDCPALVREGGAGQAASPAQLEAAEKLGSENWATLVERTELGPGYKDSAQTFLPVEKGRRGPYTHVRLNIFPDGGVARLRLYGVASPSLPDSPFSLVDLSSAALGGVCIGYSDAHYGHPRNLIKSDRGRDMGDGWETARRLDRPSVLTAGPDGILQVPGSEWAAFRLGLPGSVRAVEVDTNHFKGNYPDSVLVECAEYQEEGGEEDLLRETKWWKVLLPPTKLAPHKQHYIPMEKLAYTNNITHIRVRMFPDGGISRIGILGRYKPAENK